MRARIKNSGFAKPILFFLAGCVLSWGINVFVCDRSHRQQRPEVRLDTSSPLFTLTNPLLECEQFLPTPPNSLVLKQALKQYIAKQIKNRAARQISVYIRDLNNGPWIGLGEHDDFAPASLIKIPVMVAYYKLAEDNPQVLKETITYDPKALPGGLSPEIPPSLTLTPGQSYTVDELIRRMIVFSDNIAKDLLVLNIDPKRLKQTHADLQLIAPDVSLPSDYISVKEYASVFRILYNASYLSRPMSEKALKLLTEVEFDEGIKAGLPSDTVAAHKFGEREGSATGLKQLHECAIVYLKDSNPYLLCIMTKGKDLSSLKAILKEISGLVYQHRARVP